MSSTPAGTPSYDSTFGQEAFDRFIAQGQESSRRTMSNLDVGDVRPYQQSVGLSASICDLGIVKIAHAIEVLGTKYYDAQMYRQVGGPNRYFCIGQDTVAMILNDLSAVGARPFDVRLLLANRGKEWFSDTERAEQFYNGWRTACDRANSWFSGGETAGLHCTIVENQAVFAGSAVGVIWKDEDVYDGTTVEVGDVIIGWQSHGLMANGFTFVHEDFLPKLPNGYMTPLGNSQTVGDALLVPTDIIAPAVRQLRIAGAKVRMINNITGHGWRKIARAPGSFTYVMERTPPVPPIFELMREVTNMSLEDSYRDYNRGLAGVVICAADDEHKVLMALEKSGLSNGCLGHVAPPDGDKSRVVIQPDGITLLAD